MYKKMVSSNKIITLNIKYNNLQKQLHINTDNSDDTNKTLNDLYKNLFLEYDKYIYGNMYMFFICNNKLFYKNTNISNIIDKTNNLHIECFYSLHGGDFLDDLLDVIMKPIDLIFDVILAPIGMIGQVFIFLLQVIIWFIKFIVWLVLFVTWLFSDLLNPIKLVSDFWNSMILIIVTIISIIFNTISGVCAYVINVLGNIMQGFWGWDQSSLTKNDKNSNYFKKIDLAKGKKCVLTNNNKVPFSILLATILCPPCGVFMNLGMTGWFQILLSIILTFLWYLPGLFYSILVIYS